MRRLTFLVFSGVLGAASIAVALALVSLNQNHVIQSTADASGRAVVSLYYEAVNRLIATGDPSLLRGVVHPEMYEIDATTPEQSEMSGIEHHLTFLHHATPDARIEAELISSDESQITALVTVQRPSYSTMLGISLDDRSLLWPEVERFRVFDDLITERTASWDGLATLQLISGFPFEVDIPQNQLVTVSLNTYAPRAIGYYYPFDAPDILQVVSGELSIQPSESPNQPGSVFVSVAAAGEEATLAAGQSETVTPGSVAIMPPRTGFFLANGETHPASFLHISVPFVPPPSEQLEQVVSTSRPGVIGQTLAKLAHLDRDSKVEFAFGQASLMPGSRLTVAPPTRLLVVCTVSGALRCVSFEPGSGGDGLVRTDPHQDDSTATDPMWLLMRAAGEGILMNAGSEPVSVWILAITMDASETS